MKNSNWHYLSTCVYISALTNIQVHTNMETMLLLSVSVGKKALVPSVNKKILFINNLNLDLVFKF